MAKQKRMSRFLTRNFPKVEKVINARKSIRVVVKASDSASGSRKRPTECALARAAKREYNADGVIIGMSASYVIKGKKAIRFATPITVQRELTSFDRHHDFAPGAYKLSKMSPSNEPEYVKAYWESRKGRSGTHPRRIVHKRTVRVRTLD